MEPNFDEIGIVTVFVISGEGCHPRWPTTCLCVDEPKLNGLGFLLQISFYREMREIVAISLISGNGYHPRWPTIL